MTAPDGLPTPQRYWSMLTIALALSMAVLSSAIANVALPAMARDLQVSAAGSIWVVNAYQIAVTVSLIPLAALGDIYGYRHVFRAGVALFTLASLVCALSDSLPMLALARVAQGVGAAGVMSVNPALVRYTYPRALLGRGIGLNAVTVGISAAVGPTIAAGVLAVGPWPWLFAINIPFGLLAFALSWKALPESPRMPHRFDYPSAVLSGSAFGLLIVALDGLGHGHPPWLIALETAAALAFAAVFVRRQSRIPAPLLPLDVFKRPVFSLSVLSSVCTFSAQGLAFVALPFWFQDGLGRSQVETGLLMTPWPLAVAMTAPISGRLSDRYPAGAMGAIGLSLLCAGLLLLATAPANPSALDIGWRMAMCGCGFAIFQSPNNRLMMSSVPRERSGSAGGVLSSARLLGQTTGSALVGLVFHALAGRADLPVRGAEIALYLAAGFAALAICASTARLLGPGGRNAASAGA